MTIDVKQAPALYNVVYKITNPDGEIYVGSTINLRARINTYKKELDLYPDRLINISFKKHGIENHIFEILEVDVPTENLHLREAQIGTFYNVLENGLNTKLPKIGAIGGYSEEYKEGRREYYKHNTPAWAGRKGTQEERLRKSIAQMGKTLSEETKRKISEALGGMKRSQETRERMSLAQKGKVVSEETRKRISDTQKGRSASWRHITILDSDTGIVYEKLKDAANAAGVSEGTMSNYIAGKTKSVTRWIKM